MEDANPFRFSTKYQDDETDLLYYGYRYYNPSTGRWVSRDPANERGGNNLYAAARNNAVNQIDLLGLDVGTVTVVGSHAFVNDAGYWDHERGWYIDLRWAPPASWNQPWENGSRCRPCLMAVWTQDFSRTTAGFGGGWHTDWDESDYEEYSRAWAPGKDAVAEMWDAPRNSGSMLSLWFQISSKWRARSKVKCIKGTDAGIIYKTVEWGYDWSYDTTPTGFGPNISIGPIAGSSTGS
jgi:RHS repeat-associated protein